MSLVTKPTTPKSTTAAENFMMPDEPKKSTREPLHLKELDIGLE